MVSDLFIREQKLIGIWVLILVLMEYGLGRYAYADWLTSLAQS